MKCIYCMNNQRDITGIPESGVCEVCGADLIDDEPACQADKNVRLPHWEVKVFLCGICCLTITEDSVSGLDDLNEGDLKAIEICGKQLLEFAGKAS